jgi:hypothetical protein
MERFNRCIGFGNVQKFDHGNPKWSYLKKVSTTCPKSRRGGKHARINREFAFPKRHAAAGWDGLAAGNPAFSQLDGLELTKGGGCL